MTIFSEQITVNASPDKVWEVVANLGAIYKFNPNVSKSYYSTDIKKGIGAGRICELRPTGKVKEIASDWQERKGYTLQITLLEKAPPLKNFTAKLVLESANSNSTSVALIMAYDTKLGIVGNILNTIVIKSQLQKSVKQLLEGLKLNIEQGIEIEDSKSLKKHLAAA